MTKGLKNRIKRKLLQDNIKLFSIILYGCGGAIFQSHLFKIIGRRNDRLLTDLQECNLVRIKKVGKNNVILLKHAVFSHFGLQNKSVRLSGQRLINSSAMIESLIRTYGSGNIDAIETAVRCTNYGYFAPERTAQMLEVIYDYFTPLYTRDELSTLAWAVERHNEKLAFIKASEKGRRNKLPASSVPYTDLYALRNSGVFIKGDMDAHGKTLRLNLAILTTGKSAAQIAALIHKAELALSDTFGEIALTYTFELLNLADRSEGTEARIFKNLLTFQGNAGKEDFYKKIVIFRWFNCKNRLFSGIDIEKWL